MIRESPRTYQQWTESLIYLQENPKDKMVLHLMAQGAYTDLVPENLKVRISQTVSTLLTHRFRRFLKTVDQALSEGDPEMIQVYAVRFRAEVSQCLFYRQLPFLDAGFVRELDSGYTGQIQAFWSDFLRQLKCDARDAMNTELEDLTRELSRKALI